jgi:hypothetical protein
MDDQQQPWTSSLCLSIPTTGQTSEQPDPGQYSNTLPVDGDDQTGRPVQEGVPQSPAPSTSATAAPLTASMGASPVSVSLSLPSILADLGGLKGNKRLAETKTSESWVTAFGLVPTGTVKEQWRYLAETRQDKYHPTDQLEKDRHAALDLVELFKRNRDTAPHLLQSMERYSQRLSEPNFTRFAQETVQQTSLAVNSYLEALNKSPEKGRQSIPNHRWMMLVLPEILSAWETALHMRGEDANLVLFELRDQYGKSLWKVSNDLPS